MSMHVRQSRGQEYIRQAPATTTTSLSIPTIIEIGVGGGVGLLAILLSVLFFVVRKKHKKAKHKFREGSVVLDEAQEIRKAIRSTCPPDLDLGKRTSFLPFLGNKKKVVSNPWVDEDGLHGPQMANANVFAPGSESGSSQKGFPMVDLTKPPVLPNPQSVAPEEPFSPSDLYPVMSPAGKLATPQPTHNQGRSYEHSVEDWGLEVAGIPRISVRHIPYEPPKLAVKRRSVSDNQLTSILRSTSQRMRERRALQERRASQRPLSRAHSVLSQISGVPPSERLPSPPRHHFHENGYGDSREGLIDVGDKSRPGSVQSYDTFNYEAILNSFPQRRTPSPARVVPWSADHVTGKRFSSNTAVSDEDSLCNGKTPDLVIPFKLTSPSKRRTNEVEDIHGNENHPVNTYSEKGPNSATEISTRIYQDSRASIQALGYFDLAAQHRRLLAKSKSSETANDPFYSGVVKSARPTTRVNQILIGPRAPTIKSYEPKRTHSRRAPTILSSFPPQNSACISEPKLPLGDISGNSNQGSPSKSNNHAETEFKLDLQLPSFQWSPEPIHLLARKTPVSSVGSGITKRQHQGHKRQNVVRMSGLPRPRSVCPVPEESEDLNYEATFSTSSLDLSKVPSAPPPLLRLHSSESLTRSLSMASIYSRYSVMDNVQPPSSSVFEPRLTLLPPHGNKMHQSLSVSSMGSSPTLGPHHPNLLPATRTGYGTAQSSPSIKASHSRKFGHPYETDESTDDLSGSPSKENAFSKRKVKRMGRNFSIDRGAVDAKGSPFAFPPPPTPGVPSHTADPFSNANSFSLPTQVSNPEAAPALRSESVSPLLARLQSQNSLQRIPSSSDFLLKNITQLRRGDSNYSIHSMGSTLTIGLGERDDTNPSLADFRGPNSVGSSPTRNGGRTFPLSSRSNTGSPFKSVTFGDLHKVSGLGLGLGPSTSDRDLYRENELKVFETIEQEPDTSAEKPSRKLKSIRKGAKSHPKQENTNTTSGLKTSPSSVRNTEHMWTGKSKERSFEFENYAPQDFENMVGFRFSDDDDDGYGEEDEDIISQEEREINRPMGLDKENRAPAQTFQFQGLQNFTGDQYQTPGSSAAFSDSPTIPGLNLYKMSSNRNDGQRAGWEIYPKSKPAIAPSQSMGASMTPPRSPVQLSYERLGVSNPSANQSTMQIHSNHSKPITHSPLMPQSPNHQKTKSIEILSPSPTSSSLSQILQTSHQGHQTLQLHYPKTSRWIWEETTPKVSPSPSPDRQIQTSPPKRMYKAHSRNQNHSLGAGKFGANGMERRMGNPLSSNPTVSTLMMESELGMKEPRIIDLDEANNITPLRPAVPSVENSDSVKAGGNETENEGGGKEGKTTTEEQDIAEAGKPDNSTTTSPNHDLANTTNPNQNSEAQGKKSKKSKSHHLENIFSRHHKEKLGEQAEQENRGSLYDQDGFLKSSPAQAARGVDGGRSGRSWGVRGKR